MTFIKTGLELTYTPLGPNGEEIVCYDVAPHALTSVAGSEALKRAIASGYELWSRGWAWDKVYRIREELSEKKIKFHKACTDPGVFEISTVPRKSLRTLLKDIKSIGEVVNRVTPCVPFHKFFTGGGCHINLTLPSRDRGRSGFPYDTENRRSASTLMVDFIRLHPGAVWAFAHPGAYQGMRVWAQSWYNSKASAMSVNGNYFGTPWQRVEFRFFRMPASMQEHIDAIEYAHAIYNFVLNNQELVRAMVEKRGYPEQKAYRSKKGEALALGDYANVLRMIGLDTPRFRAYAENIKGRYYYHRLHPDVHYIA